MQTALTPREGSVPTAGPQTESGGLPAAPGAGNAQTDAELVALLRSTGTTWSAGATTAAPLQLDSGTSVISIGGQVRPRAAPGELRAHMRSKAIPGDWIPRSRSEDDRRITWEQVRDFDRDHDDRLSDDEIRRFQEADVPAAGGPRCDRQENPPRRR